MIEKDHQKNQYNQYIKKAVSLRTKWGYPIEEREELIISNASPLW